MAVTHQIYIEPHALVIGLPDEHVALCHEVMGDAGLRVDVLRTGLGLAVVKKIADEHAARVRLANIGPGAPGSPEVAGAQVSLSFSRFASGEGASTASNAEVRAH